MSSIWQWILITLVTIGAGVSVVIGVIVLYLFAYYQSLLGSFRDLRRLFS